MEYNKKTLNGGGAYNSTKSTRRHAVETRAKAIQSEYQKKAVELDVKYNNLTSMDNYHWTDFENLKALTNLTELHLPTAISMLDMFKSIGGLTNLTSLDFEGYCYCDTKKSRKLLNKVFPALSRLTTLRTGISNVDCLQKCDSLTTLAVTTSGVVDISSLQYLTNLTDLDLNTCEQLEDIGTVLLLTNLKSLDLRWTAIKSIYPLRTLTNLTSLDVGGTCVSSTNIYNSMACSFPDGFVKRIASGFNLRHAATKCANHGNRLLLLVSLQPVEWKLLTKSFQV